MEKDSNRILSLLIDYITVSEHQGLCPKQSRRMFEDIPMPCSHLVALHCILEPSLVDAT